VAEGLNSCSFFEILNSCSGSSICMDFDVWFFVVGYRSLIVN
jgi:hypothetical protein